ncbi:leucine-rich repeat domain-containing protein [Tessaracoccus sp. HDW20]|uniref:hypothetical protein n=1 Tax=Tessaracoccus coleopterorum TaxID=2714950 RepID=UPI0018D2A623|nr:hypothetical protein [Tessaracoccus coleopterorum]NHB84504.1 leucine-rich repeat domain-containing protein [Tessaracoccus coleopterorum]
MQPPAGVTVDGALVSYPAPGSYPWTFSARTDLGEHFSGTVTQLVGEPVADPANIPDPALRACVADAAGLAPGAVPTTAQAAEVTSLTCRDAGISDLTGLDLLTDATALDLAGNPLPGLGQIASLTGLERLDLSRTGLSSLAGLGALSALETLRVDGNALTSLVGAPTGLGTLSALDQTAALPDTAGDLVVPVPRLTGRGGVTFAAVSPTRRSPPRAVSSSRWRAGTGGSSLPTTPRSPGCSRSG